MSHHKIIIYRDSTRNMVDALVEMLRNVGVPSISGSSGKDNSHVLNFNCKLNHMQHKLIWMFVNNMIIETKTPMGFVPADRQFDFEEYMNTDLNGMGQEIQIDHELNQVDQLIDKVLKDESTEYRQQARKAVGELWIEKINYWLQFNSFHQ